MIRDDYSFGEKNLSMVSVQHLHHLSSSYNYITYHVTSYYTKQTIPNIYWFRGEKSVLNNLTPSYLLHHLRSYKILHHFKPSTILHHLEPSTPFYIILYLTSFTVLHHLTSYNILDSLRHLTLSDLLHHLTVSIILHHHITFTSFYVIQRLSTQMVTFTF